MVEAEDDGEKEKNCYTVCV